MGTVEYSIWIGASPSLVWDVYTNPERIPEWQTGKPRVEEVSGRGDEAGATYQVRRGPGAARTTVTDVVPPSLHSTRTDAYFGLTLDLTARLLPETGGTRLLLRAETHWPKGLRLVGRVVEFAVLNGLEANRELKRLKVLVEMAAASERHAD